MIVLGAETVEGVLLRAMGVARWRGGFCVERAMHSLMTAVLCWLAGVDALWPDTQFDPPHRQAGKSADTHRRERRTVVGAHAERKPVLAESRTKYGLHVVKRRPLHGVAA